MPTISAGSRQPSGNNLSLENSLTTQGNAPIFVDAVHAHLDNQHPFKSAPSTLKKLNQFIAKTLGYDLSSNRAARGERKFSSIVPAQGQEFEVLLPNNQKVTRTRSEVQLHILLQSQLRHVGAIAADTGDSISIEEALEVLHGAPEPVPVGTTLVAMPSPQQIGSILTPLPVPSESNESQLLLFKPDEVDMGRMDNMLQSASHDVREISSANNNCWWRAGWLSAILQHAADPQRLEILLQGKLGAEFSGDIQHVKEMAEAMGQQGAQTILTGMEAGQSGASRLKLPGNTDAEDDGAGERVLQRLTDALLAKAGIEESSRNASVNGNAMGEVAQLKALVRQLPRPEGRSFKSESLDSSG